MTPVRTHLIAAAAVVAGLAAGATGVALADNTSTATPTSSASSTTGVPGDGTVPGSRKGHHPGKHRGGPGMFGAREPLHGEFVVPKAGGGFQTVVVQRGVVTTVSKTEISVRSKDGFTSTYAVTAQTLVNAARDGIATIKKGATVHVAATKAGTTLTALHIGDQSARKAMRERFAPEGPLTDG